MTRITSIFLLRGGWLGGWGGGEGREGGWSRRNEVRGVVEWVI